MTTVEIDIETARREFRDQLIEAGLLIPMGIDDRSAAARCSRT